MKERAYSFCANKLNAGESTHYTVQYAAVSEEIASRAYTHIDAERYNSNSTRAFYFTPRMRKKKEVKKCEVRKSRSVRKSNREYLIVSFTNRGSMSEVFSNRTQIV